MAAEVNHGRFVSHQKLRKIANPDGPMLPDHEPVPELGHLQRLVDSAYFVIETQWLRTARIGCKEKDTDLPQLSLGVAGS